MRSANLSIAALIGIGMALTPALSSATLKEIHVDQKCRILQDPVDGVYGENVSDQEIDPVICHLESVHTSSHLEETLTGGAPQGHKVTIAEREYVLQNVTSEPVTFVVEQPLPEGWRVDSDPQPAKIADTTAFFRVNAEPGQIVRLHVGERHADPIPDADSTNQ
jgi:hypothetical protein